MKESILFLEKHLSQLTENFPNIECLYKFDNLDDTHIIKIMPKKIFESEDYVQYENEIVDNFIQRFPYEGILFISENELIDIDKPDKIFKNKC